MFKVKEINPQELVELIFACQENEHPEERLITSDGLMITPLPSRIDLDRAREKEWISTEKKSPNAWRLK